MTDPIRLDHDGVTYRVFDSTMRAGKLIVANPPAAWATSRVFRPAEGHRRLFRLKVPADRAIDEATLHRQLCGADYLTTTPAVAEDRDPR